MYFSLRKYSNRIDRPRFYASNYFVLSFPGHVTIEITTLKTPKVLDNGYYSGTAPSKSMARRSI